MKRFWLLLMCLILLPNMATAWWNDDWGYKKKITLDKQKLQQSGETIPGDAFALVRLHTGNFAYFAELAEQGKDFRVLAGDEKTPLKYFIEKLDTVNEMALIWVKLPADIATQPEPAFWLYYANAEAVDAQDAPGSFAVNEVLDYSFTGTAIKDLTANANNPSEATATLVDSGLIGSAAQFQGGQVVRIPAAPSLQMAPANGWTFSTWIKFDQPQTNAVVLQRVAPAAGFTLAIKDQTPVLEVTGGAGKQEFAGTATLAPGAWHNVAVVANASELLLYVDGVAAGNFAYALPELSGEITLGADTIAARGFNGLLDQLTLYKVARDANAIKFDVDMQGASSAILTYDEDAGPDSEEGGESYVVATLKNVTIDGWVIIGILMVMFVISTLVMITKGIVLNSVAKYNKRFEEAFAELGARDFSTLDKQDVSGQEAFDESPLLFSLTAQHDDFSGSPLYRIYHVGVQEMNKRLSKPTGTSGQSGNLLSASAMAAVKASMDAVVVRELQKLNSQMVLLTIAISGGPFLGLLGTVVGVMITFAAIAVSGEVNVNAIAPGIAAALTATVVGLAVAIPALFGYNYLGSQIKVVTADLHVFVDEFVAKLAEEHT